MSYLKGRVAWSLVAMAVVLLMAQVAEAQRGEGRGRGRGGRGMMGRFIPTVQLAAESADVQAALSLTDEQKSQVDGINDKLRESRRDIFDRREGDFGAAREEMQKLQEEASAQLAEVLNDDQHKRLLGISIQVNGAAALNEPALAKELKVTEDQQAKLEEARESNMRSAGEAFRELRDLSGDERRARLQELRAESDKSLLAVLTSEQQAQYESLKGEPVEVDMSEFRGGSFRARDGGGRRGEGRGRNRPDRDADDAI